MSKKITVKISDDLDHELEYYRDRMPEILARGLAAVQMSDQPAFHDAIVVLDTLAQQPDPHAVLNLSPSPILQDRMGELLNRSKSGQLSREQALELERYLTVEHLVRLAKGHAYHRVGGDM
ncbi:MAG: hypothetical protein ACK2UO_13205 [Caldilineaceae bacterium]|jgi:hypothetical protein